MNFDMINYVLSLTAEHTHQLHIKNETKKVDLFNIEKARTMEINGIRIDLDGYDYLQIDLDIDFQDEIIINLYTYTDYGDSGMNLDYETNVIAKLPKIDSFIIT